MNKDINNIKLMESYYDKCYQLLRYEYLNNIQETMLEYMIYELSCYYQSKQWIKDYDNYELGLFPKELKCGVLSQDAIYNLLDEFNEKKTSL